MDGLRLIAVPEPGPIVSGPPSGIAPAGAVVDVIYTSQSTEGSRRIDLPAT